MPNPFDQFDPTDNGPVKPIAIPLPMSPRDRERDARDQRKDSREADADRRTTTNTKFDNTSTLRKEFLGRPSVTNYDVALGTFNSSLKTAHNAQGDQSLITAYAKMLDPNSAVREGEFATTAGTQNIVNQIKARFAKEMGAGGMLTQEGRDAIRSEMRNLVVSRFKPEYDRDREQYTKMAERSGFDPYMVIGEPAEAKFPKQLLAEPGATTKMGDLPPAYQEAYQAFVKAGNFTPEQYAAFRTGLDKAFFPNAVDQTQTYLTEGANVLKGTAAGKVPGVVQPMGAAESYLNTDAGALATNYINTAAMGLPARLAGKQDELEALRSEHPLSSLAGEITGGIAGTALTSGGLGAASRVVAGSRAAPILSNPIVANTAFGAGYGATQDTENPWRGAGVGAGASLFGDFAGRALGRTFPRVFNRAGINAADNSVPTSQELRDLAGQQYRAVEATGEVAGENATRELADQTQQILAGQGRAAPNGDLINTTNKLAEANRLIRGFAGSPMTPTQAQSVREVIGEGLHAMDNGRPDANQRRIAGKVLDNFDQWAEPVLPGIEVPRRTSSRYLQGDLIAEARDLADANSHWFSQSGPENALRNSFRALDKDAVRGRSRMDNNLVARIEDVSRGNRFSNAMRTLGKLAPTSAISAMPAITLGSTAAAGGGGLFGTLVGGGVAATGMAGRAIATQQTQRAAEVAELVARGGPDYERMLEAAQQLAARRAAMGFGGAAVPAASASTR